MSEDEDKEGEEGEKEKEKDAKMEKEDDEKDIDPLMDEILLGLCSFTDQNHRTIISMKLVLKTTSSELVFYFIWLLPFIENSKQAKFSV